MELKNASSQSNNHIHHLTDTEHSVLASLNCHNHYISSAAASRSHCYPKPSRPESSRASFSPLLKLLYSPTNTRNAGTGRGQSTHALSAVGQEGRLPHALVGLRIPPNRSALGAAASENRGASARRATALTSTAGVFSACQRRAGGHACYLYLWGVGHLTRTDEFAAAQDDLG